MTVAPWLVTGGAGYIGAHVVRALLGAGKGVVVLDDLSTGTTGRVPPGMPVVQASVLDRDAVESALRIHRVEGVVHLAARKSVEESVRQPLRYYRENVDGVLALLEAMTATGVRRLVLSSTAAVSGSPPAQRVDGRVGGWVEERIDEASATVPLSPYGRSKLAGEWVVDDLAAAAGIGAVSLRYFNVVGCAEPALAEVGGTNLFPRVIEAITAGEDPVVHGTDYPTPDGTCVRDYVHVVDVAAAHRAALELTGRPGHEVVNVGRGRGCSVLEVLAEFARVTGRPIRPAATPRRPGDPASMVADVAKADRLLGWRASAGLTEMVSSAWAAVASREAGVVPRV
ncbi:MAG: UDP-glucose 4-epimerase GalE [Kineosporiaceae bacterium]